MLKEILNNSKGKIRYNDLIKIDFEVDILESIEELKEDLLQIEYENNIIIDLGWYPSFDLNGSFQLQIVKDSDWFVPIYKKESTEWKQLFKDLEEVIIICNRELLM